LEPAGQLGDAVEQRLGAPPLAGELVDVLARPLDRDLDLVVRVQEDRVRLAAQPVGEEGGALVRRPVEPGGQLRWLESALGDPGLDAGAERPDARRLAVAVALARVPDLPPGVGKDLLDDPAEGPERLLAAEQRREAGRGDQHRPQAAAERGRADAHPGGRRRSASAACRVARAYASASATARCTSG